MTPVMHMIGVMQFFDLVLDSAASANKNPATADLSIHDKYPAFISAVSIVSAALEIEVLRNFDITPKINAVNKFRSRTKSSLRKSVESDKNPDLSVKRLRFNTLHDRKHTDANIAPNKRLELDKNRNPPIPTTTPANNDLEII